MPLRVDLERRFEASSVTIQSVFDLLAEEGFIVADGRRGTFVADHLPHLCRYGLAMASAPTHPTWSIFFAGIMHCAAQVNITGPRKMSVYAGLGSPDYASSLNTLMSHLRNGVLAGVIVIGHYDDFPQKLISMLRDVPAVAVTRCRNPAIPALDPGGTPGIIDLALDHFQARGKKRVAILSLATVETERVRYCISAVKQRGMICPRRWLHGVDSRRPEWAGNLVELLLSGPPEERPEGFIVTDDNLFEDTYAGLIRTGVHIGEDIEIVTHCNFPSMTTCMPGVVRIGYDIFSLLNTCANAVDDRRKGKEVKPYTIIQPVYEHQTHQPAVGDGRRALD